MKQFDVCALKVPARGGAKGRRWVVVLQHEQAATPDMVVVAPLYDAVTLPPVGGLRLAMTIGGGPMVLAVDRLAAIARHEVGPATGNIGEDHGYAIRKALDLIFAGF